MEVEGAVRWMRKAYATTRYRERQRRGRRAFDLRRAGRRPFNRAGRRSHKRSLDVEAWGTVWISGGVPPLAGISAGYYQIVQRRREEYTDDSR